MARREELVIQDGTALMHPTTRRAFLRLLGIGGTVLFLPSMFTACNGESVTDPLTDPANYELDLSTDVGIMNFAYTLEQVEAAFYTAAVARSAAFGALSADEKEVFQDIQHHEVIHREFLRRVLGDAALPDIAFNAAAMAKLMTTRDTLLKSAQHFEDTGVAAYNGAAKYLTDPKFLLALGKIVSVEARHAAAVRDIPDTTGRLFAGDDIVDAASGLDTHAAPGAVFDDLSSGALFVSPVSLTAGPAGTASAPAGLLPPAVQGALDLALGLEIFESELYKALLGTSSSAAQNTLFTAVRATLPPAVRDSIQQIARHEAAHVNTLVANGAQNVFGLDAASFDFTGGRTADNSGPFKNASSDLPALLRLLQLVEDVGVRAYKGQALLLIGQPVLETMLRIHSVEARHAARLRRLRRFVASAPAEVRLSGAIRGGQRAAAGSADTTSTTFLAIADVLDKAYGAGADDAVAPSEANVTQLGVDVTSMSNAPFGVEAAQESFDEPLTRADVVAIVQRFFGPAIS